MTPGRDTVPSTPKSCASTPSARCPCSSTETLEIFDSTQIFEYLEDLQPDPALWPREPAARALARGLEHQSDEVYFPHIIRLMSLQDALAGEPALAAIEAAGRFYVDMDRRLASSDWLAGSYSFADIAFYMAALFGERQGAPVTPITPRLLAWRERMTQRTPVRTVVGAIARWLKAAGRPVPAFMASAN